MKGLLQAVPDLLREAFLHLEASGIGFHHAGHLAKTRNFPLGDIGHMRLADKRKHVMLAQGEEFDVLHNNHMVVRLLEKGTLHDGFTVLEIALGKELHGLGHPLGGFEKPLPGRVLPQ